MLAWKRKISARKYFKTFWWKYGLHQYLPQAHQHLVPLSKSNVHDLMFKCLSPYQGYFVRRIEFLSEQMLRSAYSTIHFPELVPASTIPRDDTGWYKLLGMYWVNPSKRGWMDGVFRWLAGLLWGISQGGSPREIPRSSLASLRKIPVHPDSFTWIYFLFKIRNLGDFS